MDRNSFPSNTTSSPPFWFVSPMTVHCVAGWGLIQMGWVRSERTRDRSLMEFRDAERDVGKLDLMVGYLATNVLAWDAVYTNDNHSKVFSSSPILHLQSSDSRTKNLNMKVYTGLSSNFTGPQTSSPPSPLRRIHPTSQWKRSVKAFRKPPSLLWSRIMRFIFLVMRPSLFRKLREI